MSELEGVSYFSDHRRHKQSDAKLSTTPAPEHQRGMRSFLTWAFMLAQIAAAEQIAGSAAASAATTDAAASSAAASDATASATPLADSPQDIPASIDEPGDTVSMAATITSAND